MMMKLKMEMEMKKNLHTFRIGNCIAYGGKIKDKI